MTIRISVSGGATVENTWPALVMTRESFFGLNQHTEGEQFLEEGER